MIILLKYSGHAYAYIVIIIHTNIKYIRLEIPDVQL